MGTPTQTMELRGRGGGKVKPAKLKADGEQQHQTNAVSHSSVQPQPEPDFETFVRSSLTAIIDGQNALRECVSNLKKRQDELEALVKVNETNLGKSIEFQSSRTTDVEKRVVKLEQQNTKLLQQIGDHKCNMRKLQESRDNLERHSRRHNLLLCNYGPESKDEAPESIVNTILKDKLGLDITVEVAHRTGKRTHDKNRHRPIIFKVLSLREKDSIIKSKRKLDDVAYYIKTDEIESDRKERIRLKSVAEAAYKAGKKTVFRRGKLYINNELYKDPTNSEPNEISGSHHDLA